MAEKKEYRNAIRSRQLIRAAFVELLHEKPLERITATDIINRSGLNRSTFYAHYPDTRGIIDEIGNEIVELFRKGLSEIDFTSFFDDPTPILCVMLKGLQENQELYRLLGKSAMVLNYLEQTKAVLTQVVLDAPDIPRMDLDDVSLKIRVRMLLGSIIDIYYQWLSGEIQCSLDRLMSEVTTLIVNWNRNLT